MLYIKKKKKQVVLEIYISQAEALVKTNFVIKNMSYFFIFLQLRLYMFF